MPIKNNHNLINFNTFKLNSVARYFYEIKDESQIPMLVKFARQHKVKIRFLGGGSNIILPAKIDALVIKNELLGIKTIGETDLNYMIACASGENWHQFVMSCLQKGQFGLENLALIPGTVGGAPIQNIGAYGIEVKDFITQVSGYDFETGQLRSLTRKDCQFEYRHSIFKTPAYQNFLITQVEFEFPKIHSPVTTYAELNQYFSGQTPTPLKVANKIIEIRQIKLPDVLTIPNVGSFFKNPIVSFEQLKAMLTTTPDLISYPYSQDKVKLAAGQLIDKLGFKGKKVGSVGMYEKQALVMVNLGNGRIEDINSLVSEISIQCFNYFGVRLEIEPIFW